MDQGPAHPQRRRLLPSFTRAAPPYRQQTVPSNSTPTFARHIALGSNDASLSRGVPMVYAPPGADGAIANFDARYDNFSVEAPEGVRFLIRSRLFTDDGPTSWRRPSAANPNVRATRCRESRPVKGSEPSYGEPARGIARRSEARVPGTDRWPTRLRPRGHNVPKWIGIARPADSIAVASAACSPSRCPGTQARPPPGDGDQRDRDRRDVAPSRRAGPCRRRTTAATRLAGRSVTRKLSGLAR